MANKLIPNTFQHPNDYIDWLSYYLTPQEEKVLTKAIREILGWQDKIVERRARISLSVFVKGKVNRHGKQLCLGCGLGISAVRKALSALNEYNILCKVGDPTEDGQQYYLQENWDAIDHEGLKERKDGKKEQNRARTEAAREAVLSNTTEEPVLSDSTEVCCETEHPPVVGQQQRNPNRNPKETKEAPMGTFLFDGLGTAHQSNYTVPRDYVEVPVSGLLEYFTCPECNRRHPWPKQESRRKKPTTLICQDRNCGVYFLVEDQDTGRTYSIPIPEPEWTLHFEEPVGKLSRITLTEREFKAFKRNWQEDCGLVVQKIQWAAGQDWLVYQKDKIAGRVNAAFETAMKGRKAEEVKSQPAPEDKEETMSRLGLTEEEMEMLR